MHFTRAYSIRAVVNFAEKRAIRVEFKDGNKESGIHQLLIEIVNFKGSGGLFPYVWLRFVLQILGIFNGHFYSVIVRSTQKHIQLVIQ